MKKMIVALALLFPAFVFAQKQEQYCEMVTYQPGFKSVYVAELSYGDESRVMRDSNGHKLKFRSETEALNKLGSEGWTLVSMYKVRGGDTHFFLRRQKQEK